VVEVVATQLQRYLKLPSCPSSGCPLMADIVVKVGEEQLAGKNAQQSNREERIFESTLRTGT